MLARILYDSFYINPILGLPKVSNLELVNEVKYMQGFFCAIINIFFTFLNRAQLNTSDIKINFINH